jgi:transcriptional regulator with XRE-family HTH domain
MQDTINTIGQALIYIRKQRNLKQCDIAIAAEITQAYLCKLEKDKCRYLQLPLYHKICKALKVHPSIPFLLTLHTKDIDNTHKQMIADAKLFHAQNTITNQLFDIPTPI